jgi:putative oxidoreductase
VADETKRRFGAVAQAALRIAAGLTYFSHGSQRLLGWFGGFGPTGGPAELLSRFGAAGVIETVTSVFLILGLFTRPVALIASGEMAVAYFWMHVSTSGHLFWWQNHGELPILYSFIWLLFAAWGAGPASLDAQRQGRAG